MIINKTTYQVQEMSSHPDDNWMGDGWVLVPKQLETKALALTPYCVLTFKNGELTDITDSGERPQSVIEPTSDELLNLLLGVQDDE